MSDRCSFCGCSDSYACPLTWSMWNLPYISEPFPAHEWCAAEFLRERITDQELRSESVGRRTA